MTDCNYDNFIVPRFSELEDLKVDRTRGVPFSTTEVEYDPSSRRDFWYNGGDVERMYNNSN